MSNKLIYNEKLKVSQTPPYDALQCFVRDNHIAIEGVSSGVLSGTTFAVKDVFKILGSTYGNGHPTWLETNTPDDFTSSRIEFLLNSGADLVGKTICDELCFSISGENWHYGSPLNPQDVRRYAGGSSSGSAVAVSANLADFSLGSDCLGSVRVPASYTGVIGYRPTLDRVPNDGEAPYCESMDVLGYMAKDADVFLKVSDVLLGEDEEEITYKRLLVPEDCIDLVEKDTREKLLTLIEEISDEFDTVEYIRLTDDLSQWVKAFQFVQGYEVWESYGGWVRKNRPRISRGPKERLEWASTITIDQYNSGLKEKDRIQSYIRKLIPKDTLLVLPTASSEAPLRDASIDDINDIRANSSKLLAISPLSGTPQITLPMLKANEVPFGVSLIGAENTDSNLVKKAMEIFRKYKTKE